VPATLTRPSAPSAASTRSDHVTVAARRLADAVAEYDTALTEGVSMFALVRLDQEVEAASRVHAAALAASRPAHG
jgi:hypothetical protein